MANIICKKDKKYTVPRLHHGKLKNKHDFTTVGATIDKILKLLRIWTPQGASEFVTTDKTEI